MITAYSWLRGWISVWLGAALLVARHGQVPPICLPAISENSRDGVAVSPSQQLLDRVH